MIIYVSTRQQARKIKNNLKIKGRKVIDLGENVKLRWAVKLK